MTSRMEPLCVPTKSQSPSALLSTITKPIAPVAYEIRSRGKTRYIGSGCHFDRPKP